MHAHNEGDDASLKRAAERGAWVEFDGIGPDSVDRHVQLVKMMADAGHLGRVLVSHDAGWYHVGEEGGGTFRPFDTVFRRFVPAIKEALNEAAVTQLLVTNPAQALSRRVRRRGHAIVTILLGTLVFVALLLAQPATTLDDAALWAHYEAWVGKLVVIKPGDKRAWPTCTSRSSSPRACRRRRRPSATSASTSSGASRRAKEMVYWNGAFKLGGGPDAPLQLLQETVRHLRPGKVIEPGMGRGRNAIWLAGLGWDVTGYDIAKDALTVAQANATRAGVKVTALEGNHDTFDFGTNQWDLILCAYCYMRSTTPVGRRRSARR